MWFLRLVGPGVLSSPAHRLQPPLMVKVENSFVSRLDHWCILIQMIVSAKAEAVLTKRYWILFEEIT